MTSTLKPVPKGLLLVGRTESCLKDQNELLPVSCTVDVVLNKLFGDQGIINSWEFTSKALRYAAGVAVHLSGFRPLQETKTVRWRPYISALHPDAHLFPPEHQVPPEPEDSLIIVQDSMEGSGGIEESWKAFVMAGYGLKEGQTLVVEVSNLRAKGQNNKRGLVASGPQSFCLIYESIAEFIATGTLVSLSKIYSRINEVLRRGGIFKNGAITLHFDYDQPSALDFATLERSVVPWARLALNIDEEFINSPQVGEFLSKVSTGDLFLVKRLSPAGGRLYHNVCVTRDTWIHTTAGPRQVKSLVGVPFTAIVDGCAYESTAAGFWSNGVKPVYRVRTQEGYSAKFTEDHKVQNLDGSWVEVKDLKVGQVLRLNNHRTETGVATWEEAVGTESEELSQQSTCDAIREALDEGGYVVKGSGRQQNFLGIRSKSDLYVIQRMLLRLGITSTVWKPKDSLRTLSRLVVRGQDNLKLLSKYIGFSNPDKAHELDELMKSFRRLSRPRIFKATVEKVERLETEEEVYDCTIQGVHKFDANGLMAHNCLEINLKPRGTCLLAHVNLGNLKIDEIEKAFEEGMEWLCWFHSQTGIERNPMYLSAELDRQVGLGVLGLANLLAIEEITYLEFVEALEYCLSDAGVDITGWTSAEAKALNFKALNLAGRLLEGFEAAAKVARLHNMDRAFTVAPTASCSFKGRDRQGYTTAPEIAPPIDRWVDRDSGTLGVISVDYHPDCETAAQVGYETFFRLNCAWQAAMNLTGLAHSISMNWWSDRVEMNTDWVKRFLASPLTACYYALPVEPSAQDKSTTETQEPACSIINKNTCTSCAE